MIDSIDLMDRLSCWGTVGGSNNLFKALKLSNTAVKVMLDLTSG